MTMTSFPWEKKTSQSFPWDERESSSDPQKRVDSSSSYKWQTPQNSYHWQTADPNYGAKKPWESNTSGSGYAGGSQTNPFDVKKANFPWEKSAVNSTSKNDMFIFGKEEPKKVGGGSYSSFYNSQQKVSESVEPSVTKPSTGSYSSFYNQSKKALFPWETHKDPEPDSLEAKMSEYLKLPAEQVTDQEKEISPEIKIEKAAEKGPSPKTPKKKISPKKSPKAGREKSIVKKERPEKEDLTEEKTPNIEIKVTISSDKEKSVLKEEKGKECEEAPDPPSKPDLPIPITSPKTPLSRSSSVTKLAAKGKTGRVKSAPPVPKHINKLSEKLARTYTSAYAKPQIALQKEERKEEMKPRLSYRREVSISEWVYPAPPQPVDWKTRSDQGLPVEAAADTQSELDSTSLREAAFKKWVAKKKENKTLKPADLVTVIQDEEDRPSAELIRQDRFEEWYRCRAVEADKKTKEQNQAEAVKKSETEILKEQKLKNEAIARRLWEEKDKERKRKIREKRSEEGKKKSEEESKLEEKRKAADKTFNNWKTNKDPKLIEDARKKKLEEKQKREQERDEKEMKEIESQKSFKAWREAKDEETREIKAEANRVKQERQKLEIRKKRKKEEATARAVQEWNDQKERAQSKINTPQHISPWKNGPGKETVVSRDEVMMANIQHKRNRERHGSLRGPKSAGCDSETVTEVEFVM